MVWYRVLRAGRGLGNDKTVGLSIDSLSLFSMCI